ncbi:T9SS type A sorting domain-containing protein [Winogradskyella sp. 4-2091]|uniref:T9SS type A sorting domain-containing protein n=1 Tax=Winogradskyella sp. 4-2091 TaxID=3381659 RepID=UPI003891A0AE
MKKTTPLHEQLINKCLVSKTKLLLLFTLLTSTVCISQITQIGSAINGVGSNDTASPVAMSADGSVIIVGARSNDGSGLNAGHARVFENINNVWTQIGSDIQGENAQDGFGGSVAISSDGTIVAIGGGLNDGGGNNAGHVRVFEKINNVWTQIGSDIDGEMANDFSGQSVSLSADGTILAVDAVGNNGNRGRVRIFESTSGNWVQIGNSIDGEFAGDLFGRTVGLSADGNTIAIGATDNDNIATDAGYVRVFENINNVWTQVGGNIEGEAAGDRSGYVAISADGSSVAIGAGFNDGNETDSGHVRIFKNINNVWSQIGSDIDGEAQNDTSGFVIDISSDGNIVAIGATNNDGGANDAGHVRLFQNQSNSWVQIGMDIDGIDANDRFGSNLSLSNDASKIAIGAINTDDNGLNTGQVKVFDLSQIIPPCTVNIPDADFKAALLDHGIGITGTNVGVIDTNNDGEIQCSEASAYTGRVLANWYNGSVTITDLTGIEAFVNIPYLLLDNLSLTSIDVSSNTALTFLSIGNNQLSNIDVSNNLALTQLRLFGNSLSSIDINQNSALEFLTLENNQLTSIDLQANVNLEILNVSENQLTTLVISNNPLLIDLELDDNQITTLDVSSLIGLDYLNAANNQLTTLNVANTNNVNISVMNALGNSNLSCIQIDAGFTPPTDNTWRKDAGTSYSDDCAALSTDDFDLNTFKIYPNPVTDVLQIESNKTIKTLEIYSITGKRLAMVQNTSSIDVPEFNNGMYFIKIISEDGNASTLKFLKK